MPNDFRGCLNPQGDAIFPSEAHSVPNCKSDDVQGQPTYLHAIETHSCVKY